MSNKDERDDLKEVILQLVLLAKLYDEDTLIKAFQCLFGREYDEYFLMEISELMAERAAMVKFSLSDSEEERMSAIVKLFSSKQGGGEINNINLN